LFVAFSDKKLTFLKGASQWVVEWDATLQSQGIPISYDTFIATFTAANEDKDGNAAHFSVTSRKLKGKDVEQFTFKMPVIEGFDGVFPMHINGLKSRIINFGSGTRPMFNCMDASPVLFGPGVQFYALVGAARTGLTETGDDLFKKLTADGKTVYQLFAIQNIDENGEFLPAPTAAAAATTKRSKK
jgi:hypothetical protein